MKIHSIAEVADYVRRRCEVLANTHQGDDAFPVKLPPGAGLDHLLETAFWASISRDEGRPCRFTVSYYGCDAKDVPPDVALALEPKRLDREILRRLAAVAFAADAEIAVCNAAGALSIIGLCKHLRPLMTDSPVAEFAKSMLPLEIEVRGPAHIVIRYAIFRILTYANGEIREPGPDVLFMKGPFRSALDDLARPAWSDSFDFRCHLKRLLDRIERHGHGALLVLSAMKPNGSESISWPIINEVYSLVDVRSLWAEGLKRIHLSKDDPNRLSLSQLERDQRSLQASERRVLELSAACALTDGGLWLDESLRPRAFGLFAEIPPGIDVRIALDADGTSLGETGFDTLGARHRAMVALAAHNPECPAIAVSVDGGFSAALRVHARSSVIVWYFQGSDLEADDPFNPQSQAFWSDLLRPMS